MAITDSRDSFELSSELADLCGQPMRVRVECLSYQQFISDRKDLDDGLSHRRRLQLLLGLAFSISMITSPLGQLRQASMLGSAGRRH
jgi:hypothetical protein